LQCPDSSKLSGAPPEAIRPYNEERPAPWAGRQVDPAGPKQEGIIFCYLNAAGPSWLTLILMEERSVVPTSRLIALVAGSAVVLFFLVLAASWKTGQALLFILVYDGFLALLVLADYLLTARPQALLAKRRYEHRFSLGAENPVLVVIGNHSRSQLAVIIKDEPPASFRASVRIFQGKIPAGSSANFRYNLIPPKRGDYSFGDINIRYHSRLGFFLRQCRMHTKETGIRVYPNIMEIRRYQLLARQGCLIEAGIKPARVVGLGTDFESLRDYQVDDEFRRINWSATARRGRLVSNQYEVDKSQNILLVLDTGRLMSGVSQQLSKLDHAINASLLLGYVGVNRDDRVGLMAFSDQVRLYLPPRRGQPQLQKILAALYNLQPEIVESDYRSACQYIRLKNRKRSLICIFTDLIDEASSRELITYCISLAHIHLVMCVTMLDSSQLSQADRVPADSQAVYEKGVALSVLRYRERAISMLKNGGVVVVNVPPEELSIATINKYLEIKSLSRI
jgi:uncharacterized protein (DUF58 family)